uniref:Protein TEX261 n=1 Tax=Rhipicephalus appendiculatus TaxID=34631 RepID=A0A131YT13_RHIAP
MLYLYLLSWVATFVQICFSVLAVAAGLYYLAELVEEFTVMTGKVIRILILVTLAIYIGLFAFEDLPMTMIGCGMLSQVMHMLVLRTFPFFNLYSVPFLSATALVILNHYLAFNFFSNKAYTLSEVLAYFTLCLWLVPFAFVVSLNANDSVLPTLAERRPLLSDDNDVVSNYFSQRNKRYNLLSFFNKAKESILPQRVKKVF